MLRRTLIYGLVGGVIVALPSAALPIIYRGEPLHYGLAIGYTIMLIGLSTIFLAIKRQRDEAQGGVIKFLPALAMGLGISVIAGILYVAAWEFAQAVTHMDFAGSYAKLMIAQEKAKGVTGAALARYVAEMEQFKRNYANPLYRLPMVFVEIFPVGVLVSLISSGLLCNSRFLPARRNRAAS